MLTSKQWFQFFFEYFCDGLHAHLCQGELKLQLWKNIVVKTWQHCSTKRPPDTTKPQERENLESGRLDKGKFITAKHPQPSILLGLSFKKHIYYIKTSFVQDLSCWTCSKKDPQKWEKIITVRTIYFWICFVQKDIKRSDQWLGFIIFNTII